MEDNFVNRGVTFFWKLFQLNCYFLISSILLMGTLLIVRLTWATIPIYLVAIFFTIPAFQGLLLTLKKLKSFEENESLLRLYFSCYKELFKESCILGGVYIILFTILTVNLYTITVVYQQEILVPMYMLLLVLLVVHFIFTLLIRVNLVISLKETLKLSIYFMLTHPNRSLGIIGICFAVFILFTSIPQFSILILPPILGYLLLGFTEKIFKKVIAALKID